MTVEQRLNELGTAVWRQRIIIAAMILTVLGAGDYSDGTTTQGCRIQ